MVPGKGGGKENRTPVFAIKRIRFAMERGGFAEGLRIGKKGKKRRQRKKGEREKFHKNRRGCSPIKFGKRGKGSGSGPKSFPPPTKKEKRKQNQKGRADEQPVQEGFPPEEVASGRGGGQKTCMFDIPM